MNSNDIYVKTPLGEEAMTQRTRVVERSQRMILVLVDGKTTVGELGVKVGDSRLAETALKELEVGEFIVLSDMEPSSKPVARPMATPSQISQFSTFGPKPAKTLELAAAETVMSSDMSHFGRPMPNKHWERPDSDVSEPEEDLPVKQKPVKQGKRLPVGKLLMGGVLALLAAAAAGVFLFPYDRYKPGLEAALSQQFGATVQIGEIGPAFSPAPSLELKRIKLGDKGKIQTLRLPDLVHQLWTGASPLPGEMEIVGGELDVSNLAGWLQSRTNHGVTLIKLQDTNLVLGGQEIAKLSGSVKTKPDGSLESASLSSKDRSFKLELSQGGTFGTAITLEASGWKPLTEAQTPLDYVLAKGSVDRNQIVFTEADVRLLGGRYEGQLVLDWGAGKGMAGSGTLHRVDMSRLSTAWLPGLKMVGNLSGNVEFRLQGTGRAQWLDSLEAKGNLAVEKGEIQSLDLAEAIRRGPGKPVRGGGSRFERLDFSARLAQGNLLLSDMRMEAGLMHAEGQVQGAASGQVSGRLNVTMVRGGASGVVAIEGQLPVIEVTAQ